MSFLYFLSSSYTLPVHLPVLFLLFLSSLVLTIYVFYFLPPFTLPIHFFFPSSFPFLPFSSPLLLFSFRLNIHFPFPFLFFIFPFPQSLLLPSYLWTTFPTGFLFSCSYSLLSHSPSSSFLSFLSIASFIHLYHALNAPISSSLLSFPASSSLAHFLYFPLSFLLLSFFPLHSFLQFSISCIERPISSFLLSFSASSYLLEFPLLCK